jgi:hypothetical protein
MVSYVKSLLHFLMFVTLTVCPGSGAARPSDPTYLSDRTRAKRMPKQACLVPGPG